MPRLARVVGVGLPHHIVQRGNCRQRVFESEYDREYYLRLISECSSRAGLSILAYCLMTNHVHFIAIPKKKDSMARTFNSAHMRYSQYFNYKHKLIGHLWQGRYFSCVLDERHLIAAARYVERNPLRAALVGSAENWKWSSAAVHCVRAGDPFGFSLDSLLEILGLSGRGWRELLDEAQAETEISEIRAHTSVGRPLGNKSFLAGIEKRLGRRVGAMPPGRPKGTKQGAVPSYKIGRCP